MARRRRPRTRTLGWILTAVFAAIALWLRQDPAGWRASQAPVRSAVWQELAHCRLVPDRNNDGDSFVIAHAGGQHTLRLYFADCAEKRRHQYNRARLAEQGAYFGGLDEAQTIRLGRTAAEAVGERLREAPFEAFTRWEPVYDSSRSYAHLRITDVDGKRVWLDQWLVARGLARIHTKGADLPDGTPERLHKAALHQMEKTARRERRGGWALAPQRRE